MLSRHVLFIAFFLLALRLPSMGQAVGTLSNIVLTGERLLIAEMDCVRDGNLSAASIESLGSLRAAAGKVQDVIGAGLGGAHSLGLPLAKDVVAPGFEPAKRAQR